MEGCRWTDTGPARNAKLMRNKCRWSRRPRALGCSTESQCTPCRCPCLGAFGRPWHRAASRHRLGALGRSVAPAFGRCCGGRAGRRHWWKGPVYPVGPRGLAVTLSPAACLTGRSMGTVGALVRHLMEGRPAVWKAAGGATPGRQTVAGGVVGGVAGRLAERGCRWIDTGPALVCRWSQGWCGRAPGRGWLPVE